MPGSSPQAPLSVGLFTGRIAVGAVIALAAGDVIALLINIRGPHRADHPDRLVFILPLAHRRNRAGDATNPPVLPITAIISG